MRILNTTISLIAIAVVLVGCSPEQDLIPIANESGQKAVTLVDKSLDEILDYYVNVKPKQENNKIISSEALHIIGYGQGRGETLANMSDELDEQTGSNEEYRELVSAHIDLLGTKINLLIIDFELFERTSDKEYIDSMISSLTDIRLSRDELANLVDMPAYDIEKFEFKTD